MSDWASASGLPPRLVHAGIDITGGTVGGLLMTVLGHPFVSIYVFWRCIVGTSYCTVMVLFEWVHVPQVCFYGCDCAPFPFGFCLTFTPPTHC